MTSSSAVHLVLPHQLFEEQLQAPSGMRFVLIEHDLLFRQYAFHSHKLVLHRASMDRFARRLRGAGRTVDVLRSDAHLSSRQQLAALLERLKPSRVTRFDVVDDWLDQDLDASLADAGIAAAEQEVLETPGFLTDRRQIRDWLNDHPLRMQDFYTWQRRRLSILVTDDGEPVGGAWSFDEENRKKLPRGYTPAPVQRFSDLSRERQPALDFEQEPEGVAADPHQDVERAVEWALEEFPDAPGDPRLFAWPTSADEAAEHLREFATQRLNDFGPYEDAISAEFPFINHGLLTASMNIGLLDPRDVLQAVLDAADSSTPLASVEGFVRQVIGWREYMRAAYITHGRSLRTSNRLNHTRQLGQGWWTARTELEPLDLVIGRVLTTGYAHHIERLMILGSGMSLLRVHPDAVYEWFMEMFIDAYDWVMVPNVYAMSQFAAGEGITTKPYVSGSNYLKKMSDLPAGEWAQDWDALYWAFVRDHRDTLSSNPRAQMMVAMLDRMDSEKRASHHDRADRLLAGQSRTGLLARPEASHQPEE